MLSLLFPTSTPGSWTPDTNPDWNSSQGTPSRAMRSQVDHILPVSGSRSCDTSSASADDLTGIPNLCLLRHYHNILTSFSLVSFVLIAPALPTLHGARTRQCIHEWERVNGEDEPLTGGESCHRGDNGRRRWRWEMERASGSEDTFGAHCRAMM